MLLLFVVLATGLTVPQTMTSPAAEPPMVALEPADRDEYVIGAGDILAFTVEGGTSMAEAASGLIPENFCTVGSDGMASVSGLGSIPVGGLTITEAEQSLSRLSARYFPGSRVRLSLYEPRLVRVRASGMVARPGVYPLYSLQRVSDLLDLCGGLIFPASHTGWMYFGADSARIDLLPDAATHRPASDPLVREGAVVVMSACESPVIVMRPSAYVSVDIPTVPTLQAWDVGDGVQLSRLAEAVGGAGAGVDYSRSVLRHDGTSTPLWTPEGMADITLHSGDTLILAGLADSVAVSGAVGDPSPVGWSPGLTAMDYVALAGGTVPGSNLRGTLLIRRGIEVARGGTALATQPEPGDVVNVPYSWISQNIDAVTLLITLVSMAALLYNVTKP